MQSKSRKYKRPRRVRTHGTCLKVPPWPADSFPIRRYGGWTARGATDCPFWNRQRVQDQSSGAPQSQVPSVSRRTAETWGLTFYLVPRYPPAPPNSQLLVANRHPQILICRATQSLARIVRHDDGAWLRLLLRGRAVKPTILLRVWTCSDVPPPSLEVACGLKRRPAEAGRWGGRVVWWRSISPSRYALA